MQLVGKRNRTIRSYLLLFTFFNASFQTTRWEDGRVACTFQLFRDSGSETCSHVLAISKYISYFCGLRPPDPGDIIPIRNKSDEIVAYYALDGVVRVSSDSPSGFKCTNENHGQECGHVHAVRAFTMGVTVPEGLADDDDNLNEELLCDVESCISSFKGWSALKLLAYYFVYLMSL